VDVPSREDLVVAAARIGPYIRRTPVLEVGDVLPATLKLDLLQPTGTFKVRGAFSLLLSHPEEERVVAASGGNFALAIAHAAARLGRTAELFVPSTSPPDKIDRLRATGAAVEVIAGMYPEALEASRRHVGEHGGLLAHAYDLPEVVAGAGTCALEIATQTTADTVLVAVGGGGLIAGVASWFRGDVRVIGVETEGTATLYRSRAAGRQVEVELSGIAVSSLGTSRLGDIAWEASTRWVAGSVLVTDQQVVGAQRWLWDNVRLIAEPGAAAPLAALLSGAYQPDAGERVVVIVCGANTLPSTFLN
jgi:threonine dehydratase